MHEFMHFCGFRIFVRNCGSFEETEQFCVSFVYKKILQEKKYERIGT